MRGGPRSKTGCLTCKERKVRCPEQRPICNNCERLNLTCEYADGTVELRGMPRVHRSRRVIRFVDCNVRTGQKFSKSRVRQKQASETHSTGPEHGHTIPLQPVVEAQSHESLLDSRDLHQHSDYSQSWDDSNVAISMDNNLPEQNLFFYPDLDSPLAAEMNLQFLDMMDSTPGLSSKFNVFSGEVGQETLEYPNLNRHVSVGRRGDLPSGESTVIISSDRDHRLIQHFLNAMNYFSTKLRQSTDEDLNCQMFSNMGIFNPQLFHAMMAFAALHLAQTEDGFFAEAELRYQRSSALLFEDENPTRHLDVTIATVWFLLQYELLKADGVIRFCNLLAHMAHTLDKYQEDSTTTKSNLSKLGARTLVWMSAFDLRALSSGGSGGYLLRSIETFVHIRPHLEEPSSTLEGGPLASISQSFGDSPPIDHVAILRIRLRCNLLHSRILMLRGPVEPLTNDSSDNSNDHKKREWRAIYDSLIDLHDIFHTVDDPTIGFPVQVATGEVTRVTGKLSSLRFGHLLALSSLYAALIDYGVRSAPSEYPIAVRNTKVSYQPPTLSSHRSLDAYECASRMIRIAYFVQQNSPKSPQSIWPSLLFSAGTESLDGIHRSWVLTALKEAEPWATHFSRTRVLLEAVYEHQTRSGQRKPVDVLEIQARTTGQFVI